MTLLSCIRVLAECCDSHWHLSISRACSSFLAMAAMLSDKNITYSQSWAFMVGALTLTGMHGPAHCTSMTTCKRQSTHLDVQLEF